MAARRKATGRLILLAAFGGLGAYALGWALHPEFGRETIAAATRFTVRWSLLWFLLAWSASALARLWPGGWRAWLLFNRRGVGLGFAAAHFIHASAFIAGIMVFGRESSLTTIVGGGLGYVFVALMALTSTDGAARALGPWWKRLHTFGAWYVAFIFAFTYVGMIARKPEIAGPGLALIAAVLLLKAAAWVNAQRPAAA